MLNYSASCLPHGVLTVLPLPPGLRERERLPGIRKAPNRSREGWKRFQRSRIAPAARWLELNDPNCEIGLPEVLNKAQRLAADEGVKPLAGHGEIGNGRSRDDNINSSQGGTSTAYLVRRLKRDAPEVAQALARGEYKSARAAGIAAGIVRVPSAAGVAQVLRLVRQPD